MVSMLLSQRADFEDRPPFAKRKLLWCNRNEWAGGGGGKWSQQGEGEEEGDEYR